MIFAAILIVTSGMYGVLRAYLTNSVAPAFVGVSLVAIGFALSAMRVHQQTPAVVFIALSIAASVAGLVWRKRRARTTP